MFDVLVIGGGPGGSTASTLLARKGHRVLLLEKERFPRFQIGESLLPYNNDIFERLGVADRLSSSTFVPKYGATFLTGDGEVGYSFRFGRTLPERYSSSIQVRRSEFDEILLRNAQDCGVDVRENMAVKSIDLSSPERAVVTAIDKEGREQTFESRFLIDASGHAAAVASRLGTKRELPSLKKISFFAHYENVAPHLTGPAAGDTVIVVVNGGWFWLIPVSDEVMSVGLVADREDFLRSGLTPEQLLDKTIAATPYVARRLADARREGPIRARKDFSYSVERLSGPNYALVGDAAGFIDPIFSTGVFMAMKSADLVADATAEWLTAKKRHRFQEYERRFRGAYEKYLRFVSNFYKREFLEIFLQPSDRFGLFPVVIGVLAGSVFEQRRDRFKLAVFFALVGLQKRFGFIAPRIAWDRLTETARA
jgi:FADH2-dependent halogenase